MFSKLTWQALEKYDTEDINSMLSYEFLNVDDAVSKLPKIKKGGKKVLVCVINFDNEQEDRMAVTYDEGCKLIKNAKTIIHNDDPFIPHMELFSVIQKDINNIIKRGVMHDIILPPANKTDVYNE